MKRILKLVPVHRRRDRSEHRVLQDPGRAIDHEQNAVGPGRILQTGVALAQEVAKRATEATRARLHVKGYDL